MSSKPLLWVYLPAEKYEDLKVGSVEIKINSNKQNNRRNIDIKIAEIENINYKSLSNLSKYSRTPLSKGQYIIRTSYSLLSTYCKKKSRRICAFIVEKLYGGTATSGGDAFKVLFIASLSCEAQKREDLVVIVPYYLKDAGDPWIIAYIPKCAVNISDDTIYDITVKIGKDEVSYIGLAVNGKHVNVYPKSILKILSQDSVLNISNNIKKFNAKVNEVFLGSILTARSKRSYWQSPFVIPYDVYGSEVPQIGLSGVEGIKLEISLTLNDIGEMFGVLGTSGDALVKVLINDFVARSVVRQAARSRKGSVVKRWLFWREIVAKIMGEELVFTAPIFGRIKNLYERIYKSSECSDVVQTVLDSYRLVLEDILRSKDPTVRVVNDAFYKIKEVLVAKSLRIQDLLQNRVLSAMAVVAALYGAHGLIHALAKGIGVTSRASIGELIEIEVGPTLASGLSSVVEFDKPYDGLYIIRRRDAEWERQGDKIMSLTLQLLDLEKRAVDVKKAVDVAKRLLTTVPAADLCLQHYQAERMRLNRVFAAVQESLPEDLKKLDAFLSRIERCPHPPRDVFRFQIRDLYSYAAGKAPAVASDGVRKLGWGLMYIWPRHIRRCADGCHTCVRAPRFACVLPPVHEGLTVSKALAWRLAEKLGL